jgi:intein/homing endonuclease
MGDGMPKFIGNVKVGDVVVSHDGSRQRVVDTFEYEVDEDLVEVTTADGRVFRCTPEHGVFIQTPEGMKEVQAKDLKEGDDVVEVLRGLVESGKVDGYGCGKKEIMPIR